MATYEIQGADVELLVRVADTGSFKEMVCDSDFSLDITNDVSTTKTKRCGVFKSTLDPDFKINGTLVHNTEPTNDEFSYDQIASWQKGKTKIEWIARNRAYGTYAAGEAMRFSGYGYFTNSNATFGQEVVKATFTIEGVGILNDTES